MHAFCGLAFASPTFKAAVIEYNPIIQDPLGHVSREIALSIMRSNVESIEVRLPRCFGSISLVSFLSSI
jgi:hypothetical protein